MHWGSLGTCENRLRPQAQTPPLGGRRQRRGDESEPPRHYLSQLWEGPELASMGATWQIHRWWNEARRRRVNVPLALFCWREANRQGQGRQTRATISNSLYAALTCG
jgi:hypothetical protein